MDEYISRDAAVEKITFLCELREIVCNPDDEFLRGLKNALNAVKSNEIIPSADVQPMAWISVDDKLPATRKTVLIYDEYEGISAGYYDSNYTKFRSIEDVYRPCNVTHWMPLPDPPVNP